MDTNLTHEIELYSFESFTTLLDHELNRSRRYQQPLTLVHVLLEVAPDTPEAQHSAEMFAINVLNLQLRETDIPCRKGTEFLVLMPSTDEQGGRVACERLEKLFQGNPQPFDKVSFSLSTFIGMTSVIVDKSLSSSKLLQQAHTAMQHARDHRITTSVIYSDIA